MNKYKLLFHTIKYLKFRQVYYRVYYYLRNVFFARNYAPSESPNSTFLEIGNPIYYSDSFLKVKTFSFLNLEYRFENEINWNYSGFGKLWTFNLNYFDFLNQKNIDVQEGLELIHNYIENDKKLKEGHESYTISLRGINWIKFLSKNKIENQTINQVLYNHYQRLLDNLELQFLGNHYLENGFSLLFGAYYFRSNKMYQAGKKILKEELKEQVLNDGAHFELSPMYHQTMLHRVLDCVNLTVNNSWKNNELSDFFKEKAIKMLSWLQKITFDNGNIPMVNDSTYGIAPTSKELFEYAKSLKLSWPKGILFDSGYRKIENGEYELFIDVGPIGASYQPAHVHSDTFNFELYIDKKPVIVDTGTSTYEKNYLRQLQRSTESHNTIKIGDINQSKVWNGFRVAERAKIVHLKEIDNTIEATHNGYKKLNVFHTRRFIFEGKQIIIKDKLSKETNHKVKAFLHFYPGVEIVKESNNSIILKKENIQIDLRGKINEIVILDYDYSVGFNKTEKAKMIQINFIKELETHIYL